MGDRSLYDSSSTNITILPSGSSEGFIDQYARHLKNLFDASTFPLTSVGGTADAVTASLNPTLDSDGLVDGMMFTITWAAANTVPGVTLSINGAAGVSVVRGDGSALLPGDIQAGLSSLLLYTSTKIRIIAGLASALSRPGPPDVVLQHQEASGTAGGSATTGSWEIRKLTTIVRDVSSLITLNTTTMEFSSTADMWVRWTSEGHRVDVHQSRLYNVTDSAVVAYGTTMRANSAGGTQTTSQGMASIVAGKNYRIEHRVNADRATDGYGATGSWGTNVYANVEMWRL